MADSSSSESLSDSEEIKKTDENSNSNSYNDSNMGRVTNFNTFANDGSFLEIVKKKMEAQMKESSGCAAEENVESTKSKTSSLPVGKRRAGKVLKTGMVKKPKVEDDANSDASKDAWSRYMAEVKKYKQHACDDEGKTRPLVK